MILVAMRVVQLRLNATNDIIQIVTIVLIRKITLTVSIVLMGSQVLIEISAPMEVRYPIIAL